MPVSTYLTLKSLAVHQVWPTLNALSQSENTAPQGISLLINRLTVSGKHQLPQPVSSWLDAESHWTSARARKALQPVNLSANATNPRYFLQDRSDCLNRVWRSLFHLQSRPFFQTHRNCIELSPSGSGSHCKESEPPKPLPQQSKRSVGLIGPKEP